MKFLIWLFSFAKRHRREILSYEKGKTSSRVVAIVMMTLFTGATIAMELFTFKVFESSFGWGVFSALFTIAMVAVTSETSGVYAYCGFRFYAQGTLGNFLYRVTKDYVAPDPELQIDYQFKKPIDLAVGILGVVFAVGVIVATVTILLLKINGALMALQ